MQGVVQHQVASMLGLTPGQIRVHTTFLGGCFGRALEIDFVLQAVAASKSAGRPVKLIWSREEDLRHDYYRPAVVSRLRAALGADGMPIAWEHRIVAPSISSRFAPGEVRNGVDPLAVEGAVDLPYAFGAQRIEYVMKNTPVPVGNWRSVGHSHNAYFVECFIDEIAGPRPGTRCAFAKRCLPRARVILRYWKKRLPPPAGTSLARLAAGWGWRCTNVMAA